MSYTKRGDIRQQQLKKKRQQRLATLMGIAGVIIVIVALFGLPTVINKLRPPGEFIEITPKEYPLANGRAIGNPEAKVVIEVFSDFQCPACKNFAMTTEAQLIETEYINSGQVYYIARHFPFEDNSSAIKASDQAANASMCAAEQNRFWDYHMLLFTNQDNSNATAFSDRRLVAFADSLGLDMNAFNRCFNDNAYEADILADIELATAWGVTGTPTVFLNGQKLGVGNFVPTYEDIITEIETALSLR